MSVAATCLWGGEAIAKTWRERNTGSPAWMLVRFVAGLKPLLRFFLYMVPMYFVLMDYYLQSLKDHQSASHKGTDWISDYFWDVKSIVYFTDWHIDVHHALLGVLGMAMILSLIYRIRRKQWFQATDPFLLIAILFTIMFIKAPWGFGPGGWINDRIHLYIPLMLGAWLVPDMGKVLRYGFTGFWLPSA
jgi:hypothetical protein